MQGVLPFAKEMLVKDSEFYPFGGAVLSDGTVAMVGAHNGDEHPPSQALTDLLESGARGEVELLPP